MHVTLHSFRVAELTAQKLTEEMDRLWVWLILLCEFFLVLYNEFLMNFKMKKE